jgi:exonuclease VII small subunit
MMAKKKDDEVILQFFEEYDMEVAIHVKNEQGMKMPMVEESFVLTGLLKSPKNITIIAKDLFERAKKECKPFASWLINGRLIVLDEVPSTYYDAKELAADARQKVAEAEKKVSQADAALIAKDEEIAKLKAELKGYGAK